LVFSAAYIIASLENLEKKPIAFFTRAPSGSWRFGQTAFTTQCQEAESTDGGPIGGADPVGIGGDGHIPSCIFTFAPSASPANENLGDQRLQAFHATLLETLTRSKSCDIPFGLKRDAQGYLQGVAFLSPEQLLQTMNQKAGVTAVRLLPESSAQEVPAAMRASGRLLLSTLKRLSLKTSDTSVNLLLRQMNILSNLAMSPDWTLLEEKDFDRLLAADSPFRAAWATLAYDVQVGQALRRDLESLQEAWQASK
jgi:hypothetical protein